MPTIQIDPTLTLFYEDDWFGEPWNQPEVVLLIHGISESSRAWFGWVPCLSRELRVLRPDWRGFGRSTVPPADFKWSTAALAADLKIFLDKLGIEAAHIVGAKFGGSIAFQFAADYPGHTRTLSILSGPVRSQRTGGSMDLLAVSPGLREFGPREFAAKTQRARLGSEVSEEQIAWWTDMMGEADPKVCIGVTSSLPQLDLSSLLSRIQAPTLLVTTDRSPLQSVKTVLEVQRQIPKSELLVLPSDSYHIAAVQPDECAHQVLKFIMKHKGKR
jgi:3-oxoadipate enol-lactonase